MFPEALLTQMRPYKASFWKHSCAFWWNTLNKQPMCNMITNLVVCTCLDAWRHSGGTTGQASGYHDFVELCSDSQFKNQHHVCAVLVHVVQRYDVLVLELLQDAHFPLNLLSSYTSPAGPTLTLLDELGSIFGAGALLFAAFHYRKLPTANKKEKKKQVLNLPNCKC